MQWSGYCEAITGVIGPTTGYRLSRGEDWKMRLDAGENFVADVGGVFSGRSARADQGVARHVFRFECAGPALVADIQLKAKAGRAD